MQLVTPPGANFESVNISGFLGMECTSDPNGIRGTRLLHCASAKEEHSARRLHDGLHHALGHPIGLRSIRCRNLVPDLEFDYGLSSLMGGIRMHLLDLVRGPKLSRARWPSQDVLDPKGG